jgi:hypothetical protein
MSNRIASIVRIYLCVVGAGLLLEGAAMLVLGLVPPGGLPVTSALFEPDPLHNSIHVIWGLGIVLLLATGLNGFGAALLALVFGAFYVALACIGVLVDHPFGLILGPGQNGFHFIVGPTALLLGICGLWANQVIFSPEAPQG